ncbi:MAG: phosphatidylglycerophosphatase A [Mariprofundaceae bacterium]
MIILAETERRRGVDAWIAAGLGSGWLPRAPGTWGSLAALPPGVWLLEGAGPWALALALVGVTLVGCIVCARMLPAMVRAEGKDAADPGWIVIDEWAGMGLALLLAAFGGEGPAMWAAAFIAFRFFDVFKPWPVSWCERHGPAWWRVMADDLMAGLLAGLVAWGALAAAGVRG